jgi:hypothetical protein
MNRPLRAWPGYFGKVHNSPLAYWKLAYAENEDYSGASSDGEGNSRVFLSEFFFVTLANHAQV